MKTPALYSVAAVFFFAGILFFLKGFFLTRVELSSRSTDALDIHAAFNGLKQTPELSQRFLSKSVLDLGHSLHSSTSNHSALIQDPYFSLFKASSDNDNNNNNSDQKVSKISPIALLSTIHSMPNSIDQLFSSSLDILTESEDQQTCSWFCRQYDQIFFLVIDALRFDFLQYNATLSPDGKPPAISADYPPYINRLSNLASFHESHPANSAFYKFRADTPTVTMQLLKALLTGSLPTFLDVKDNFAASTIQEDNLLVQMTEKRHHSVMVGDDTWMGLVGPLLTRPYPYPSFDVHDLDTVDNGCVYRIHHELCGRALATMKLGLEDYFQQFIHDNRLDRDNNKEELTQLRREALQLSHFIASELSFEKDSSISKASHPPAHTAPNPYPIPNEINYHNITTAPSWFIAHFLGVDHVGHRFGPRHPLMDVKLRQMNELLQGFLGYIDMYSDHTANYTKPFFASFSDQFNFVSEYCDKSTVEPFATKLPNIQSLINKQSQQIKPLDLRQSHNQLHLEQYSTKAPLSRSVVYVLGDHGMTEGGNHGGASVKETQAGFAVFSTLTLDSPSSYIKHQQLHHQDDKALLANFGTPHSMIRSRYKNIADIFEKLSHNLHPSSKSSSHTNLKTIAQSQDKLPQLTLIYDYSHINNYDDVYTQTKVQSPDEEAFSMGQIDALPTLSLIAGIPIPYGSLGVLKKELVPNQFLNQHHGRLIGSYAENWTSSAQICSIFSTFSTADIKLGQTVPNIDIKIAELRHEIMILHLRVLNLGQVLRYAKDYTDTVRSFSGAFIQDALRHTRVIWAKLEVIEEAIVTLSNSCVEPANSAVSLDQLAPLMDDLYPSIIDTSQHIHLVLTHIKAGFTREWTQYDMANMYAGIITFAMSVIIVVFQFLQYVLRARKNESLDATTTISSNSSTIPAGAHYQDPDQQPKFFAKLFATTNVWALIQTLLVYSALATAIISILPLLLFLCPHSWVELHFPLPQFLIKFNEMTANAPPPDEDATSLAQAVTTTATSASEDVYTIHILSFWITVFTLTFIFFFSIYRSTQFWATLKHTRSLSSQEQRTFAVEEATWSKFFVVIAVCLGLIQGFFSNVFIEKGTSITHTCCVFLAGWAFFAVNGSFRYYFSQMNAINASYLPVEAASDLTSLNSSPGGDDVSEDDQSVPFRLSHPSNHRKTRGGDDIDDEAESKPLVSRQNVGSAKITQQQQQQHPTALPRLDEESGSTSTKINSPFLQKNMLSPSKFLLLSILAFLCVVLMSLEGELADTNSKLLFNIPFKDHDSIVSWYQNLTTGGVASTLQTIFENADDILLGMANIELRSQRDIRAELAKPKVVDAVIHQNDNDHSHAPHDDHGYDDDDKDNDQNTITANIIVDPSVSGKTDPSQVAKAALNMFSPDIALDGVYVRKEARVLVYARDSTTNQILLSSGELYKEEEYNANQDGLRKQMAHKFANRNVTVKTIVAEFATTSVDTRSHYSSLHTIIILALFIITLYALGQYVMTPFRKANSFKPNDLKTALPTYIYIYNQFLTPITACYVACYWLPTYIAILLQPIVQLFLSIGGTCTNLHIHNQLLNPSGTSNTFLSASDQLQLCVATPSGMRGLIVQFLRLYIPSLVYVTFVLGMLLFTAFIVNFVRLRLNKDKVRSESQLNYNNLVQFYSPEQLLGFAFIVIFPTVCLVSGPRATVVYALYVILLEISKRLVQTMFIVMPYNKQLVHLTNFAALFVFITLLMFHATGHAYSFNDIHIAAGFVGLPGYIFGVSEALVFFNSFGGLFFGTFGCLMFGYYTTTFYQQYLEKSAEEDHLGIEADEEIQIKNRTQTQHFLSFSRTIPIAWFMLWTFVRILFCTMNLHYQRRDLFLWALYAPYWLMITVMSIITTLIIVLYTFSLPPEQHPDV